MAESGLICLGAVVKPHGIRGECVADLLLEDMGLLEQADGLHLLTPKQWEQEQKGARTLQPAYYELRGMRGHKGRMLLTFAGIEDRDAAETLRGLLVCIPERDLPPPDEDEVYCYQLVGCEVLLEDGAPLGVLQRVETPTDEQELWTIVTPTGDEVLLPAHPETVVDIDIDARQVRIAPPEGLLELYLEG